MNPSLGKPRATRGATFSSRSVAFGTLAAMLLLLPALPGMAQQVSTPMASSPSGWTTGIDAKTVFNASPPGSIQTFAFTPAANGMLVVTVSGESNPSANSGSGMTVSYAGTAMTLAGFRYVSNGYAGIWYMINPSVGNGSIVVTSGGTNSRYNVYAIYASGVNQAAPEFVDGAQTTSTTTPTPTETPNTTPSSGALVVTTFGGSGASTTGNQSCSIFSNGVFLSGQTQPTQPPNAGSISAISYTVVGSNSPVKGVGATTNTSAGQGQSVVIASFAPAPPSAFDHFAVTATSLQTAGTPFPVTITGQDSANATVANSTAIVTVSSPSAFMEFDWNGDTVYGDNSGTLNGPPGAGVKTIQARNKKAETTTIAAAQGTALTTTPPSVTTEAGAYAQLQILAPGETAAPGTGTGKAGAPSIASLNTPFNVTVNAVDSNWNVVPFATADPVVAITSTDTTATLPTPPVAISANSSLYSVTMGSVPGPFTVTATDEGTPSIFATTPPLTVYGDAITWVGGAGGVNLWNTSAVNWAGVADSFSDGTQVTFGESGSKSPAVDIQTTVSPVTMTVNHSLGTYTFGGAGSIAGTSGGFIKSNSGTVILSTVNTYTGLTTLSGGVMIPTVAGALPSTSALILSGGLIGVQNIDFTRSPGLGAGQVKLSSGGFAAFGTTGVVSLGGISTPVSLTMASTDFASGGTLALSHADATRAIELKNPIALQNGTNFFNVADSGSVAVDAILSGVISAPNGGSGLSKTENGTLMLSNTGNTFNQSFIDNGTIILGAADVLPNGANFTIKKGNAAGAESVLDLNGFSDTVGAITLGDPGTGNSATPSIINSDISTLGQAAILTLNGNLNYNAATTSPNGRATISANLATGPAAVRNITVGDGTNLEDLVISGDLSGGAISKLGLGVLVLEKPIYSGNTTVSAGKLIVRKTGAQTNANANNDASTVTITAGATLNLEYVGTDTVRSLVIGANPPLADGVYGNAEFPAVIVGTGTITVLSDPYLTWAGAGVPFDGDANNDGVQNGLAWLLGAANPTVNANGLLPVVTETGGGLQMAFSMLNAASRGAAVLEVQHSSDLGISDPWTGVVVPNASVTTGGVTFVIAPGSPASLNNVQATISSTEAAGGKVFGRLRGVK